tara:strand:+ start:257 stop:1015 length:759 start_codon:yes stop_codon:yes gene_type:complete
MKTVGFFYTVFKEKRAVDYSIQQLRQQYPDSSIYLVSDGGLDFSYLENEYDNMKTILEEDTMSSTFGITAGPTGCDYINGNYRETTYQEVIKRCAYAVLRRIVDAIEYCGNPDWMVMCDPDCLIRGQLNFPEEGKILGSRFNCCLPQGHQNILKSIDGAIPISRWGASPCVFEVKTFLKALEKFRYLDTTENLLDKFSQEFYAMYAHDVLFPTIFALIGEEETFNPDIVECIRNPNWKNTQHPLVHQFREYY